MAIDKKIVDEQIARLGDFSKWFTKKERNYLHEVLSSGEEIRALTSGLLDGTTWLVTVTNRRVVFLDKGMIFGLKQMELPISHISAVSHKTGLMFGKIEVSSAGGTKTISMIEKQDVPKIAQIISDLLVPQADLRTHPAQSTGSLDVVTQLERLAGLNSQGFLSDDEFAQQKSRLLSL